MKLLKQHTTPVKLQERSKERELKKQARLDLAVNGWNK